MSLLCTSWVRTRLADAARNRPERYGERTQGSPAATEQLAAMVRSGMDPDEVAERVMRAIRENELHVFTHPEIGPLLEERFQRILAAQPRP